MPPPGARRPDNATYDRVATWLETALDRAAAAHVNPGRPGELHRLNRTEYGNAIRDLLGLEIDPKAMLPADEQAHGFSTNADALSIQPALLDRYLSAAAKIARLAVGDPAMPAGFERYTAREGQLERVHVAFAEREARGRVSAGVARRNRGAPLFSGRRRVRLQASAGQDRHGDHPRPSVAKRHRNSPRRCTSGAVLDRRHAGVYERGKGQCWHWQLRRGQKPALDGDDRLEVRVPVKAGMRQVDCDDRQARQPRSRGTGTGYDPDLEPRSIRTSPITRS